MHEMIHSMATPFGILRKGDENISTRLVIELLQLALNMTYAGQIIESTIQREML